jgi:alkylated DNA repair dioxygenase AlkB
VSHPLRELAEQRLDAESPLWLWQLPERLRPDAAGFAALWALHPPDYHEIESFGRRVATPRWQQAYARDYVYSGSRNDAQPIPPALEPLLDWSREALEPRLNGVLVNWYDGALGHYIGRHHDSVRGLLADAPIAMISLGERRSLRMRRPGRPGFRDFELRDGSVVVLPLVTNARWKHEVPASKRQRGRRISVTLRAFADRGSGVPGQLPRQRQRLLARGDAAGQLGLEAGFEDVSDPGSGGEA